MSCVEANVEPGQKRQDDDVVLADRKLLGIPVTILHGVSMLLLEAELQLRQF